ncbi:MAG: iron-sulfur cluster assembly accessory protein [Acidimicrobiia bacterium]|nr:MAG: iron-sulfur cluster assembly accessory protein [Acidimicrobiia bacterium]
MTVPETARRIDIPVTSMNTQTQGVVLTPAAAEKVKALIEAEGDDDMALRVGVKRSGCSGYAYDMFFDSTIDPSDIVNETDGVRVVVDAASLSMVAGATVDFKDDGLAGAGFAIDNPNVSGTCGCGKSFS